MFWSRIAGVYDLIEKVYNGKCNERTTDFVASLMQQNDSVLECACGTGMFSVKIAPKVRRLTATDFSEGMLKKAGKKCRKQNNVLMQEGDMAIFNSVVEIYKPLIKEYHTSTLMALA